MTAPDPRLVALVRGDSVTGGPDLAESAIEHRLTGQLLSAGWSGQARLSVDAERVLTAADLANAAHHARLWSALTAAHRTLDAEGIGIAALKGVTSEARWYSRVGERPCSDVDIWLAPDDIDRIERVLEVLAPAHPSPAEAATLIHARRLQHVHFEWCGVTVDLHLDPLKLGVWSRQLDDLWRATSTVVAPDGTTVRVLGPEAALVAALTHANKDEFATLGAFAEIVRIASTPDLDWDLVERIVLGDGLGVCVPKSLEAVADVVPVAGRLAVPSGFRPRGWDQLWPPERRLAGDDRNRASKRQALLPILMPGRTGAAVKEWCRVVFPSRALLDVHVPELRDHGTVRRMTWDRVARRRARR